MLNCVSHLNGSTISASDGRIGHVKEVYFDDQAWAIRYLVVDTGSWLSGREVLVSPYSVRRLLDSDRTLEVALTREQVERSPHIDTHQPISRRHELEYLDYYAYPAYWGGEAMWAMNAVPLLPDPIPPRLHDERDVPAEDVHLRSSAEVKGYDIQASDDSIGHVMDYLFDDASWAVRYLVIDTRNWWPGGKKVLIGVHWIESIDWSERSVRVRLTRAQVQQAPQYDEGALVARDYEQRLHDAYQRRGYWTD